MVTEDLPEYVGVAKAADLLGQKRSNVAKFLKGRDVPSTTGPAGKLWRTEAVLVAKRAYDADVEKRQADERRRSSARETRRRAGVDGRREFVGPTQERVLKLMLERRRITVADLTVNGERMALIRLEERDFIKAVKERPKTYSLTPEGRRIARGLLHDDGI